MYTGDKSSNFNLLYVITVRSCVIIYFWEKNATPLLALLFDY